MAAPSLGHTANSVKIRIHKYIPNMSTKASTLERSIAAKSLKRKDAPQSSNDVQTQSGRGRAPKRAKIHDARTIVTQTSEAALSNGELDLQAFLKAREFEITALEDGLRRSKDALSTRAFQQVPRDMRRRTASHNVKRVPKRLQRRAMREMKDDNTPTIKANKRKPTSSRERIREDTIMRLDALRMRRGSPLPTGGLAGRKPRPKLRKGALNKPPMPISKYGKRQMYKTWLPTHIYHAKRAKMTKPTKPLWRFAIPLTPTEKSYRPTHRAGGANGALCWDMSYISTIGLEGPAQGIVKVMRLLGVTTDEAWGKPGRKWREGKRSWNGWMSRDDKGGRKMIGLATIIWCGQEQPLPKKEPEQPLPKKEPEQPLPKKESEQPLPKKKPDSQEAERRQKPPQRRALIRVHPAAFLELWDEILRISKMQRPVVRVEDLRFEIGSIEMTGPGSTETLLGVLHPYDNPTSPGNQVDAQTFKALGGLTNPASLPPHALLSFSIQDPRLRYPPRKADLPSMDDEDASLSLLQILSTWPADRFSPSTSLFSKDTRFKATRLPSQKSLNRRKGQATPGEYPALLTTDPQIPILLYITPILPSTSAQGTWTLLAPWKCILPIWYSLVHYPLSSGGNPRASGLVELRQIHFEQGRPWFPADYPGTDAGWAWEMETRQERKAEWDRRPKGKKTAFESLSLDAQRKGEVGLGWACDFERLMKPSVSRELEDTKEDEKSTDQETTAVTATNYFQHLCSAEFSLLSNPDLYIPPMSLATVRIILCSRGVPKTCARIYRLPLSEGDLTSSSPRTQSPPKSSSKASTRSPPLTLRERWISFAPPANPKAKSSASLNKSRPPPLSAIPASQRSRAIAEMLLEPPPTYPASPDDSRPPVPDEDDLIGFVTTANFNLSVGRGSAVGSLCAARALERLRAGLENPRESRLCIVRNAGEPVGRLGIWEPA